MLPLSDRYFRTIYCSDMFTPNSACLRIVGVIIPTPVLTSASVKTPRVIYRVVSLSGFVHDHPTLFCHGSFSSSTAPTPEPSRFTVKGIGDSNTRTLKVSDVTIC